MVWRGKEGTGGVVGSDPGTGVTDPREVSFKGWLLHVTQQRKMMSLSASVWVISAFLGVLVGHLFSGKCLYGCWSVRCRWNRPPCVIHCDSKTKASPEGSSEGLDITQMAHVDVCCCFPSASVLKKNNQNNDPFSFPLLFHHFFPFSFCLHSEAEGWDSRGDQRDWKPGPDWREVNYLSTTISVLVRRQQHSPQPLFWRISSQRKDQKNLSNH